MVRSIKRERAEATLPAEMLDMFEALVVDYETASERHVGKKFVNYNILADLLLAGWRKHAA